MVGWRKLSAWALVYAFVVVATMLTKEIGDNSVELVKWTTGFFFSANALEHFAGKVGLTVGKEAK